MVNNGARSQRSLVKKTPLEVDRALLDLNTVGTISLTKAILPHMIKRREGQIVVVSSVLGKYGNNKNVNIEKYVQFQNIHTLPPPLLQKGSEIPGGWGRGRGLRAKNI